MVNRPVTCLLFVLLLSAGFASAQQLLLFHRAVDIRAPQLQSATVASNGTTVSVVCSEPVLAADASGFTIDPNGGAATLTLSSGSNTDTLVFTASRTILNIETATLAYSSTTGDVTDLAGNDLVNSGLTVTNNSTQEPDPVDVVAPEYVSSAIGSSGLTVAITFDEAVITDASGFTFTPSGGAATLTYDSGSGTSTVSFTSSRAIEVDETATIAYSSTTGDAEDLEGNDLATFGAQAVTNNSTYDPSDPYTPIPPETFATTYELPVGGATYTPADSAALTAALASAEGGDVIVLQAGTTYTGNFKLRDYGAGTDWVYIVSSDLADLPPAGERVGMADAADMPRLTSNSNAPLHSDFGAHHYRLVGIEIVTGTRDALTTVQFGYAGNFNTNASEESHLPHHITMDRCLIHSTSDAHKLRHGMMFNGKYMACVDSYIANCKDGSDAQAIFVHSGLGPYKINNNYLEGTGENVMFGGSDTAIPGGIPSDIEMRGNYLFKRLSWKNPSPNWTIKNSFELKNAQRIWFSGNVLENNWTDGQTGTMALITVRNQSGNNPWATVRDLNFENNIMKYTSRFIGITGEDDLQASDRTQRMRIHNNLGTEATNENGTQPGFLQFATPDRPILYLTVTDNTFLSPTDENNSPYSHLALPSVATPSVDHMIYRNNIMAHGYYDHGGFTKVSNGTYSHNVMALNPSSGRYAWNKANFASQNPGGLMSDPGQSTIGFVDLDGGNYRLDAGSQWKGDGYDGADPGCDIDELETATAGAISGVWSDPEEVAIVSATTNSDGDALTVVFDGAVTITDATGLTVETSGGAVPLLTYGSGTATDTVVFSVSPRIGGDSSPLLSYDDSLGNISGLADVVDAAITNNSVKPIPPLEYLVPELPATLAELETGATVIDVTSAAELTSLTTGGTVDGTTLAAAAAAGPVVIKVALGTYLGSFTFPALANDDWIYVVSANYDSLPASGTRTQAGDRANMPLFKAADNGGGYNFHFLTLHPAYNSQKYRFVGLAATYPVDTDFGLGIFGAGKEFANFNGNFDDDSDVPRDIIIDRCEIYGRDGLSNVDDRKGVNFDVDGGAIIDSRIVDIAGDSSDDPMGIMVTFAGRNLTFENLEVTGSGENIIFGGTDGYRDVHDNLVIRRCWLHKPRHWFDCDPSWDGQPRTIKNLLEFKKASKVLVEDCIFEDVGETDASQRLTALVLTVRNQSGSDLGAVVEHVEIKNSFVRRVGAMLTLIGEDNNFASLSTNHIHVHDMLYYDQNYYNQFGESLYSAIQISQLIDGDEYPNLIFDHIGVLIGPNGFPTQYGNFMSIAVSDGTTADVLPGFVIRDCIFDGYAASTLRNAIGMSWPGNAHTIAVGLAQLCPGGVISNNLVTGEDGTEQAQYPAGNFFETNYTTIGFADYAGATEVLDFLLTSGDYRAGQAKDATDGTDLGPDINAINAATEHVITGDWN